MRVAASWRTNANPNRRSRIEEIAPSGTGGFAGPGDVYAGDGGRHEGNRRRGVLPRWESPQMMTCSLVMMMFSGCNSRKLGSSRRIAVYSGGFSRIVGGAVEPGQGHSVIDRLDGRRGRRRAADGTARSGAPEGSSTPVDRERPSSTAETPRLPSRPCGSANPAILTIEGLVGPSFWTTSTVNKAAAARHVGEICGVLVGGPAFGQSRRRGASRRYRRSTSSAIPSQIGSPFL